MGGAARVGHGPYAAGPGAAAHREGQDRRVPVRSDPRCSCDADGLLQKIVTASLVEPVQVLAVPKISLDRTPQRSAVRRTQMVEQLVEVPTEPRSIIRGLNFEVFSQDRFHHRLVPCLLDRTLTFQFCVVGREGAEVFKVLVQDRVQQHRM